MKIELTPLQAMLLKVLLQSEIAKIEEDASDDVFRDIALADFRNILASLEAMDDVVE